MFTSHHAASVAYQNYDNTTLDQMDTLSVHPGARMAYLVEKQTVPVTSRLSMNPS